MGITVVNETGESDYYVGFSNTVNTNLATVLGYFKSLTGTSDGIVYKMATNDKYYDSGDFAYVTLVQKGPTGGALVMRIADLVSAYGDGLGIRITNSITDAGVFDYYQKTNGTKYPDGIIPLGTVGGPTLYVKLPSYTITSNVLGSSDPSDYSVGDLISKPMFAYSSPTMGLAIVNTPFIRKSQPGGWPHWLWVLIAILVIVVIAVVIAGAMMGYKKYKNR